MTPENSMLVLIGFQNDYFASDGALRSVIEETMAGGEVVANTVKLIAQLESTPIPIVETPILFTDDYSELAHEPQGILAAVKAMQAFRRNTPGAETIPELRAFGERITTIPGKHGINAFSNTDLDSLIARHGTRHFILAGAVTSVCIDSTGRSAYERGLDVHVLSDCTSGRTMLEQKFYCEQIFPIYAQVLTSTQLIERLGAPSSAAA
jgi:nicotinamidase-related amidase